MDSKMIAILIYVFLVIVFMFIDAMVSVGSKRRFYFWQSFWVSLLFPFTVPLLIIMSPEITRKYPDE